MSTEISMININSPAEIYKHLTTYADKALGSHTDRKNLDVVMDIHWFFMHSKYHKENFDYKKHINKWKYDASSPEDLIEKALTVIPFVAKGDFPVVKFTNLPNVFSGEKQIVFFCFPFGPSPIKAQKLLKEKMRIDVYWGSEKFQKP